MASNWRQTYEQLKRRKEEMDNTSNKKEQKQVDDSYKVAMNQLNKTGYSNVDTKLTSLPFTGSYIKTTNNTKKDDDVWYKNILKSSNAFNNVGSDFNDGYDFGDVTKTILKGVGATGKTITSTIGDIGVGALKGVTGIGDSAGKLIAGGVAQVADWTGNDDYAEKVRNRLAGKDEETNKKLENYTPTGILNKASKSLDVNSVSGDTLDEVAQGVGYYGGMLAAQSVGVPWQVTAGVGSGGNELANAYANNATDLEAWLSAGISAGVEIGTEYISGGVKLPGTGKTADTLISKVTDKIGSKGLKYLLQGGFQVGGEGLEEVISGLGSAIGQKLTYMDDKELKELYSSEDALKDFVIGAAVSGVTMGASPSTYNNIKTGRSLVSGLTTEEAKTIETETNKRIKEQENQGITLTNKEKNNIEEQVKNELFGIKDVQNTENDVQNAQNNENTVQNTNLEQENAQLKAISNQIQELENQLDTSQNATQQQEIINQIQELGQQYNAIQQQEQTNQLNNNELPIKKANVEEVKPTTTQETKDNLTTEVESNTQNNVNNDKEQLKTYYHGTRGDFETFDNSKIGQNYEDNWSILGKGFYFTDSYDDAKEYGEASINDGEVTVKEAILDIKNPLFADDLTKNDKQTLNKLISDYGLDSNEIDNGYDLIRVLKRDGYDSTEVLKQYGYDGIIADDEVMVFDANQINLTKTNGTENSKKGIQNTTQEATQEANKKNETDNVLNTKQVVEEVNNQVEEAIAPLQETIKDLKQTIEEVKDIAKESKGLTIEDLDAFYKQSREDFNAITDNDVAPTINYDTAGVTENNLEVESPLKDRNIEDVGDRKVKAYQYENPEVRPYFQKMAGYMLGDLNNSTKGERQYNDQVYYDTNGESGWYGTKRQTTDDIAELLDTYNYTYADIEKGLNAIIEDHGAENIAVAKRIEFALDERLRNGYTDVSGYEIPADQDYINLLQEKEFSDYYSSIPMENIAPLNENIQDSVNVPTNENVSKTALKKGYETIEPNRTNEDKYTDAPMIRVKPDRTAFENAVEQSNKEIKNELGYIPKNPTLESTYEELTDTSEDQRIAEILTEEPKTESQKNKRKWAIFKANVLDKGSVFEDTAIKNKNRDLMGKWDYTLTSEARAQSVIGNGHTEYDANTKTTTQTSKSLNDIIAEVENTGLKGEFYDYMYHKHNVDRMNLENRAKSKMIELEQESTKTKDINVKDQIAKEIQNLSKTTNKPVFGYDITSDVSQRIVDKYESENPVFMDYAQDVYDYVNADRQQLVKEGVISQETADLWSEMYPHYVPIRRVDSKGNNIDVPLDTNRTGVNAPIKKATGGNTDILPLFDTMAMRTLQTYRAVAKNNFGVELKNTLGTTIDNRQTNIDEIIDSVDNQDGLLQEGKNGSNPTFTVFENGERVTYEITQDMYDALKPVSESSFMSKTIKPLNTASSFHRGLLTEYNPVFMLTNAVKDAQDVLINSQHAAKTYSKIPEAFAQLSKKGYWYQEYIANGGEQNSYFDSQENTFKTENTGIKKLLDLPPLSTISKLNNFIEMTPRLAEYIASREAGRSVEVSMLDAARVTTNFKAGGNFTKFLNRNGATFLNASVQGAMQQVRNVREANMNGLRGWANLATKFAVAGLPAILLNGLMWKDDDDYEELSDYVKQNYYVVWKNDDGTFIRIPKGRTVAVIQDAITQVQNAVTGDDEADLKSFLDLVLNNLAPNNPIENNILSPVIQVANNKTWYGEDMIPTRLKDLPANEQYDESTDMFSRWLGDKINVSPIKINYLLNQYSGGLGDMVLPSITPKATNDAETLGDYLLAPMKDKFTTNAVMNNKNVGDLYDTSEKLTTNAKSSKATDEDVLKNKFINSIKTEMNDLYTQKREIQNDTSLSKGEKYEKVLEIQSQINELSKYGLDNYENININDTYATVGNRQYKLNDKGEWQKLSDDQIEKQDKVTSSLGISENEYWSNKEEYDYAYEKPDKYKTITAITDYDTYKTYSSDIYDLKADKDSDGKSISGSRKEKVISYVNSLDLSIPQKAMMIRQEYSSFDDYNNDIVDYVSSLDISYEDKVSIFKGLDMTVDEEGYVHW